ncbi:MAG: hypothetical protein V3W11_00025 [bacterium]
MKPRTRRIAKPIVAAATLALAARNLRLAPGKPVYVAFKSHSLAAEPAAGGTDDQ